MYDKGYNDIPGECFEKAPADGCFASANLAREQYEPPVAPDSIKQKSQGLPVLLAHVEIARIGRNGKRRSFHAEIFSVHIFSTRAAVM